MRVPTLALGATVLGAIFILGPLAMVKLNAALGWPRWQSPLARIGGGAVILTGIGVALYCSEVFARIGEGTPIPIEPPKRLVLGGLYRYSRNPMYIADVTILLGLFLHRGELTLLLYAAAFAAVARAWVVRHEEPLLRMRFGEAYVRYTRSVPRWLLVPPRRV